MAVFNAAVWKGKNQIEIEERPMTSPGPGEVLLKVRVAGICGTDLHILSGRHPEASPPLVPGHEFAGQVCAIGEGVDEGLLNSRVGADSYKGCGECLYCRTAHRQLCERGTCELGVNVDGGWEEYVVVPAENVYPLPETVSYAEAGAGCILNCPMAAIEAVKVHPGDKVLIIGDGPSSLVMLQLARLKGASEIIVAGHRNHRLALAKELGADIIFNTHEIEIGDAVGPLSGKFQVVIDAVGRSETLRQALQQAGKRARVHLFGLPEGPMENLPMDTFIFKEISLVGSTGVPSLWKVAMKYLSQGLLTVKPIISHRFPIEKAPEALEFIWNNPDKIVKVIFEMNG